MNLLAAVAVPNEPMTTSLVPRSKHHAIELESSLVSLLSMKNGIFLQVKETASAHTSLASIKEVTACEAGNDLQITHTKRLFPSRLTKNDCFLRPWWDSRIFIPGDVTCETMAIYIAWVHLSVTSSSLSVFPHRVIAGPQSCKGPL